MPNNSQTAKIEAVKSYGASCFISDPKMDSVENLASKLKAEKDLFFVHPYDDLNVIAGQATVAYELIDEVDDLDYIVCSVLGGGLLAGTLLSNHYFRKNQKVVKVIAAEPESIKNCYLSFKTGM
jgi:threonine dehydratase